MPATGSHTFWHYKDASGTDVVVDRLEDVPAAQRAKAEPVTAAPPAPANRETHSSAGIRDIEVPPAPVAARAVQAANAPPTPHLPSVAVGFTAGMSALLLLSLLKREGRFGRGTAFVFALAGTIVLYFSQFGVPGAAPTTQAREAAKAAEARQAAETKALEGIEAQAK